MAAQTQLFPKREAVQQLKDRLQAWCAEENRREQEGAPLPGGASTGARQLRRRGLIVVAGVAVDVVDGGI